MALPLYLALTAPELSAAGTLPKFPAYMACHFSSYSTGISNYPPALPEGSMLILNDSIPPAGHDPALIARQLSEAVRFFKCSCVLLDLQRPFNELTDKIADAVISGLSCPVAVSEGYAKNKDRAVFLSVPPASSSLQAHIAPWKGRSIWLEIAPDARTVTVDRSGSRTAPAPICEPALLPHRSEPLHCHYKTDVSREQICFTLQRTADDLKGLLFEAEGLGIAGAVGLYQELGAIFHCN